jgi:hypothetical protein
MGEYPESMGSTFLSAYRKILEDRVLAKTRESAIKKRIAEIERLLSEDG